MAEAERSDNQSAHMLMLVVAHTMPGIPILGGPSGTPSRKPSLQQPSLVTEVLAKLETTVTYVSRIVQKKGHMMWKGASMRFVPI